MTLNTRLVAAAAAALVGSGVLCPICGDGTPVATARTIGVTKQPGDTATVKLHLYDAKVTLDDSLGVVQYDARKVTAAQIAAHLTGLTGYGARTIPESPIAPRSPGRGS